VTLLTRKCIPICLFAIACAPANKVAEELDGEDTEVGDTDASAATDTARDAGLETGCHAGGGDRPCAVVAACETSCGTDTACLAGCRASLCTVHETVYCDMHDCIETSCGALCDDRGAAECLTCIPFYCAVVTATCSGAVICEDEDPPVK
jgi:hypothetical protein